MKAHVLSGLDGISRFDDLLQGKRVGLMTNPTGIDHQLRSSIDILNERYRLSALCGCEHGVRGDAQAGDRVDTYTDAQTGVTVYSVYGKSDRMTREMLDTFDVLVFDIQDVGARFYTYLYSLSYAMEECAKAGKTVLVLDRINPIGTLSITAPEGYTALDAVPPAEVTVDWAQPQAARFKAAMDEDFGTPEAVAVLFELATEINKTRSAALSGLLKALGGTLGLLQGDPKAYLQAGATLDDAAITALIDQRAAAKLAKNFAEADRIRQDLLAQGVVLKDGPTGTTWEVAA